MIDTLDQMTGGQAPVVIAVVIRLIGVIGFIFAVGIIMTGSIIP